jgi:mono/diheme cytochrome c family protein
MPVLPFTQGIVAPEATDQSARGAYLVNHVMGCTDCHTPIDPNTGAPILEKYLAGRQPYEGPWGIVYGGNITPHNETGLGTWTDDEVKRAIVNGIGQDGRRLILMPWFAYAALTPEDADAVVHFLRNDLAPVDNAVPAASLNPDFMVVVPQETSSSPEQFQINSPLVLVAVGVLIIAIVTFVMSQMNKRRNG